VRSILSTKYLCSTKYIIRRGKILSSVPAMFIDSFRLVADEPDVLAYVE
jgi:hypothetical protein